MSMDDLEKAGELRFFCTTVHLLCDERLNKYTPYLAKYTHKKK